MPECVELNRILNPVDGITRIGCEPESPHLGHLRSGDRALPEGLWEIPMLLHAHPAVAPELSYAIWACWMSPEGILEPALELIGEWGNTLGDRSKHHPILLLARAVGRSDMLPIWDARLHALLDDRNSVGSPDGRLLMLASPHYPTLATGLSAALSLFFASILPNSPLLLPQGCLFLRSGHHSFVMEATPSIRLFPTRRAGGKSKKGAVSCAQPAVPLPPGLSARCHLHGNLLWGAWRGEFGSGVNINRFVASTSRANRAFTNQFEVADNFARRNRRELMKALVPTEEASPGYLPPVEDRICIRFLDSIKRRLQDSIMNDEFIQRALKTPYQLLYRESSEAPLSMSTVELPPNLAIVHCGVLHGNSFAGAGAATMRLDSHPAQTPAAVPLSVLLLRPRDLQVIPPMPNAAITAHPGCQKTGFVSSYGPNSEQQVVVQKSRKTARPRLDAKVLPVDKIVEMLDCLHAMTNGIPVADAHPLRVKMTWQRPPALIIALLPEIAQAVGLRALSARKLRRLLYADCSVECILVAELSPVAIHAVSNSTIISNRADVWLRSAAACMQKSFRAFLALSVLKSEADCLDSVWTRSLLVHRHARLFPSVDETTLVLDPRKDADFVRTASGAFARLQRKSALWQQMLRQSKIPYPKLGPEAFAAHQVRNSVSNPFHLRSMLLEEQELCEQLRQVKSTETEKSASKTNQSARLPKGDDFARALLRPANRMYPGGAARELVPLLVFSACAALAGAKDPQCASYSLRLQPIDNQGKPAADPIWLDPMGKSPTAERKSKRPSYPGRTTSPA